MNGSVFELAEHASGDLIAVGSFTIAGGGAARGIARWNGSNWSPLGAGINPGSASPPSVLSLTTTSNGDIITGGQFTTAGSASAENIARWDGTSWSALASGITGPTSPVVFALLTLPNGDIIAGGRFSSAGGVAANSIARWDGTSWSPLGGGVTHPVGGGGVLALTCLPNGDIIAGGRLIAADGLPINNIARWDGSSWSSMGTGTDHDVVALTTTTDGNVIAGGRFTTAGGLPAVGAAKWDGSSWSPLV